MLYYGIAAFYVIVCLLLLLVVLLQQGRAGDIASAFGGSSSQAAFGARAGATLLSKLTAILAALFMLGALALSVIGQRGTSSSVVSGVQGPAPVSAPKPATPPPAQPKPAQKPPTPPAQQQKPPQ